MINNKLSHLILYLLLISTNLYSKENLFFYEEALKTEKVSPIFSLQLYETFLKQNPPKKYSTAVIFRLFDLYYNLNKTEELLILSENYKLDKTRIIRLETFIQKLSKIIGISSDEFKKILKVATNRNENSREVILEVCNTNKNTLLINYIFALKFKMNDLESINYLLKQIPDINPLLVVIYNIKENNPNLRDIIENLVPISSTDDLKKEIFHLFGLYLSKNRRYKEAIRYYKMSNSLSLNNKIEVASKSSMEIAKNLYIKGRSEEACNIISEKKINVQNESDEFLKIYCDQERSAELIKISSTIKFLSRKENGLVFKRYIYDKNI